MEKKINIAELLKDCPQGMELDCVVFNNVTLECVSNEGIWIKDINSDGNSRVIHLTPHGEIEMQHIKTKCVIFPKGKTTWDGFVPPCKFKDGDIIASNDFDTICIFKGEGIIRGTVDFYCGIDNVDKHLFIKDNVKHQDGHFGRISRFDFATEEEKATLFKSIRDNGYKWNTETKTLEKLIEPKFKVGDRIRHRLTGEVYMVLSMLSNGYGGGVYDVAVTNEIGKSIDIKDQDNYELVPNKFDITTLKPFDKVLYRMHGKDTWCNGFYCFYKNNHHFVNSFIIAKQCIPYKKNEYLLGTTNDCNDFYKTWEK